MTALLVAPGDLMGRFRARRRAIAELGADDKRDWRDTRDWTWYTWETVTAAWSAVSRRVLIAADPWCTEDDWSAACDLLTLAGYDDGQDIGEPEHDLTCEAWVWDVGIN
jgi:hypothetical protein